MKRRKYSRGGDNSAGRAVIEDPRWKFVVAAGVGIAAAVALAKALGRADGIAFTAVLILSILLSVVTGVVTKAVPGGGLREVVPVLVVALSSAGVLVLVFWWTDPGPPPVRADPMSGDVNVAVADFEALDEGSELETTGAAVAGSLFAGLQDHLACGQIQPAGSAREDFLFDCRAPGDTPLVRGSTDGERAEAAARVGSDVLADVVLYGTVDEDGRMLEIAPALFLSDRQLDGALELAGVHELGIHHVDGGQMATTNRDLRAESASLALDIADLILALSAYASGEYDDGLTITESLVERGTFSLGEELPHLLAGNLHLQLNELDAADDEYSTALAVNEKYARAHIGRGEVAYQRALGDDGSCAAGTVDEAQIDQALTEFQRALDSADQPAGAGIAPKAAFGKARAHICRSRSGMEEGWDTAKRYLDEVLTSVPAGEASSAVLVADSLILTAQIALETARTSDDDRAAIDPLKQAIALDPPGERVPSAHALLGLAYERLEEESTACDHYGLAADSTDDPFRAADYAEARENLGCD